MASHLWPARRGARLRLLIAATALLMLVGCSDPATGEARSEDVDARELAEPPRRYIAEWLVDTAAAEREEIPSPFLYREAVNDQTGTYVVESHNHLVVQTPADVVVCAAISRVPFDPYCASAPRADGTPNVLAYPIQLLRRDWSPSALYDLASYREVVLASEADPDNWSVQRANARGGYAIECFLVTGDTSAAATGFEICFTDDELHLVASVDLQHDLIFEVELLTYDRAPLADDFETGFEDYVEDRPNLQDQLLDLYPEIPAARPTPTPDLG